MIPFSTWKISKPIVKNMEIFLNLPIFQKIIITYGILWVNFILVFCLNYILHAFFASTNVDYAINQVADVGTQKMISVYNTTSQIAPNHELISESLMYYINNIISCIVAFLSFSAISLIYLRDAKRDNPRLYERHILASALVYAVLIFNPISLCMGMSIPLNAFIYVLSHAIFEYLGLALAIVSGIEYGYSISPIKNQIKHSSFTQIFKYCVLCILCIGIAAILEPITWEIVYILGIMS